MKMHGLLSCEIVENVKKSGRGGGGVADVLTHAGVPLSQPIAQANTAYISGL